MQKKLCEISSPKQWKTISSDMLIADGYPVYGANGIIGYFTEYNHECETLLITCRGATCGALNICQPYSYVNGNAMALDNLSDDVDIKYLYYYLLNRGLSDVITGSAQPQIVRQSLDKVIVEYPSLSKQKEIASNLNRIEELISFRTSQLSKLDELVKSRFIELFGDPVLNQYNWDVVTIGDIVTDVRYGTSRPATEGGKYPYLRMNNLTFDGHLDLSDLKYIDIPENEIEKCIVRKGDVLFNRTNSIELVGKTCVFDLEEDMVIAGYIIRVRLNEKVLPIVLSSYMNSTVLKEQLRSMAKGAVNQANINAQELQSIKIYLPPLDLQNEFATFVEQTDKLKFEVKEALEKLEILKKSLMQQYFG